MDERIAVVGLGYVGLPVALAFAKRFPRTIGFDVSARRVEALKHGIDETNEVAPDALIESTLEATTDPAALRSATFFVVAVLYNQDLWALAIFVAAGITDALDGLVARWTGQHSVLGAFLDPMADKLLMTAAFIVLSLPPLPRGRRRLEHGGLLPPEEVLGAKC